MLRLDQAAGRRARRPRRERRSRKARRFRKPRRPPRQLHPFGLEGSYGRQLVAIARRARVLVDQIVVPELERIQELAGIRADALPWIGALDRLFRTVRARMAEELSEENLERLAGGVALETSAFNRAEMTRQLRASIGVDIFLADPTLTATVAEFTTRNVALIKSIPEQYFGSVEKVIRTGFRKGQRAEQLRGQIADRFGVSERRAQFIARDQISKINGQLTEERQTELGLAEYIWRTSQDERVRETHRELEGTTQKWSEPPVVSDDGRREHPGGDFQCRCTAEPKIPGVAAIKTSPRDVPRDPELVAAARRRRARRAR
jgi:SPP1 gp7 family putative phage head morphogenesis protein